MGRKDLERSGGWAQGSRERLHGGGGGMLGQPCTRNLGLESAGRERAGKIEGQHGSARPTCWAEAGKGLPRRGLT